MVFPRGEYNVSALADARQGSLSLTFSDVPSDFMAWTTFDFYDYSFKQPATGSEGFLNVANLTGLAGDRGGDLLQVHVSSELSVPSASGSSSAVVWLLSSSESGQLGRVAYVHDNGKSPINCPTFGFFSTRLPDNAVRIRADGPDPSRLSLGAISKGPRLGGEDPFGIGGATESLFENSQVIGDHTVYAGRICPDVTDDKEPPAVAERECTEDTADAHLTGPGSDEDAAIAAALGEPAPSTDVIFCIQFGEFEFGSSGSLNVGSIMELAPSIYSLDGRFAVQVPTIMVQAITAERVRRLPVRVRLFTDRLISTPESQEGVSREAPSSPYVTPRMVKQIDIASPPLRDAKCDTDDYANGCVDGGRFLEWTSEEGLLSIRLEGVDGEMAELREDKREHGQLLIAGALAVLIPGVGYLAKRSAGRRGRRGRAPISSRTPQV
jgi:hypothetical protein